MTDLLKEATRALKEQTDADGSDGRFTRARVMASLHQGKVKHRTRWAFILPIAACLAVGTAWGAATGRLPALLHAWSEVVRPSSKPLASKREKPVSSAPVAKSSPATEPGKVVVAPPSEPVAEAKPVPRPAGPAVSARPAPSTRSSAAFEDADGDWYRSAHEAHFTMHDYARALSGWEAYLRAAPTGRFATEARYNRAICLLRLGRESEARHALEPFASGQLGYRQSEARELLEALSK